MVTALQNQQFSLAAILVTVIVYAFSLAIVVSFSLPVLQIIAAESVLTLFVAVNLRCHHADREATPRLARLLIFVAYYATAFACGTAACLVVFLLNLDSYVAVPPQSWRLAAVFARIAIPVFLVFLYLDVMAAFSAFGFIASIIAIGHCRTARWFAFMNLPGTIFFCFSVFWIMLKCEITVN